MPIIRCRSWRGHFARCARLRDVERSWVGIAGMMQRWSVPCAVLVAATAACRSESVVDRCFILVARVVPDSPVLQVGDTLTVHAAFGGRSECTPADTTPAGLRWISSDAGVISVDPFSGRLTARGPGWAGIVVSPRDGAPGGGPVLGMTSASVLEPTGADTLTSFVANLAADSATVTLYDANGALLRSATLPVHGVACWVTPLSDSIRYSAQVYLPGHSGATSLGAKWVVRKALASTHTWRVTIDPQSSGLPTLDIAGISPDRGC